MGLVASLFASKCSEDARVGVSSSHHKKIFTSVSSRGKAAKLEEWKRVVEDFKDQLLDSSYLFSPVRSSTVQAAAEYTASSDSSLDHPALMPGTHKHLGGAYDPTDGCIYGVPANARSVLCLYPVVSVENGETTTHYQMKTIPLPATIADCNYKWLRGIFAHGYLWAIPSWADHVLCVDVDAYWGRRPVVGDIVQLLPLPLEHHSTSSQWQWHGAGINHEKTAIYCIPSNADQVLKVDLLTKTTSLIPVTGYNPKDYPNFSIDTSNKWYGGIVGADNCVYGIPYRTCAVLRIDCTRDTATLFGPDHGNTKFQWHGGIQQHGKIYAHPSHANTVLVIDTNPGIKKVCYELPIRRAAYDTDETRTYKWLGGSIGADGNIYCPACDASAVLKIDVTTEECTTFGFAGTIKNKVRVLIWLVGQESLLHCHSHHYFYFILFVFTVARGTVGSRQLHLLHSGVGATSVSHSHRSAHRRRKACPVDWRITRAQGQVAGGLPGKRWKFILYSRKRVPCLESDPTKRSHFL